MELLKKLLLLSVVANAAASTSSMVCNWEADVKAAHCSYAGLSDISSLNPETKYLNLSRNNLMEISTNAFRNAGLINLQGLILAECNLTTIHENAFSGLEILARLDLSYNYLTTLHANTFQGLSHIQVITLNDNLLEKLEDNLFYNLPQLYNINLRNNKIVQISVNTFKNTPSLDIIDLSNNRLEYLNVETLNGSTLLFFTLNDNPWRCDCKLQPFRNWAMSNILLFSNPTCAEPANLYGKEWKDLNANDFACQPDNIDTVPTENVSVPTQTSTQNTLTCQVNGNPLPDVHWSPNSQWQVKYYVCGDYLCMAARAVEERVVKLSKVPTPSAVETMD